MRINPQEKQNFGNFSAASVYLQNNVPLNRGVIDALATTPYVMNTNNEEERRERLISTLSFGFFGILAPVLMMPALNRIGARMCKLDHKAVHESFAALTNLTKDKTVKLVTDETKRNKLIDAKTNVLIMDLLTTGFTFGMMEFANNIYTRKKTGKSGFSAEFEMADSDVVANRASHYQRTEKQRIAALALGIIAVSTSIPLMLRHGLKTNKGFLAQHAKAFDYHKGIYQSRTVAITGGVMYLLGRWLSARNNTELKDTITRNAINYPLFYGGDIVIGALAAGLSDRIFKTKITNNDKNPSLLKKIIPKTRKLEDINKLVAEGKLTKGTKHAAMGIYWGSIVAVAALIGYTAPYICNKMIKSDVKKDAVKQNVTN